MIKNDIWIKERAILGMIEPFESKLIRQVGNVPVLSYGLGSYSYDIRLSPKEFRIFRHIPGTVVDPKNFNPDNLEPAKLYADENGSFFILPAHSYGLGVALERLEVPENITVICIGKSTMARCFTGDTKVKLVDGDYTFLELIERVEQGDRLFGFGILNNEIVVQELTTPRYIEHSQLVQVTLDSGEIINCTPDHRFMIRDGSMVEAQDLHPGQSLRPIYQHHSHKYPAIYDSVKADTAKNRQKAWGTVHLMTWDCLVRMGLAQPRLNGWHVHHIDGDVLNAHPLNLECISSSEHIRYHNEQDQRYLKGGAEFKRRYQEDLRFREHIRSRLYSDEAKKRAVENGQWWRQSNKNRQHLAQASKRRWEDSTQRAKQAEVAKRGMASLKRRNDITRETVVSALMQTGTIRGAAKLLKVDRSAFRRFPEVMEQFKSGILQHNHKVANVKHLNIVEPTYCLTAPETGNFALSAGVFVSNCGIIANVTPAEAGWKGYLTLEFSNSSSADVRIYANEGIVALIFLQGEVCSITYQDRHGKYQGQEHEVTLARV